MGLLEEKNNVHNLPDIGNRIPVEDSSEDLENIILQENEDPENNNSNDWNPYRQQLSRVNVEELQIDCIKKALIELPIPSTFWEPTWVPKKMSSKSDLLLKRIKHL